MFIINERFDTDALVSSRRFRRGSTYIQPNRSKNKYKEKVVHRRRDGSVFLLILGKNKNHRWAAMIFVGCFVWLVLACCGWRCGARPKRRPYCL